MELKEFYENVALHHALVHGPTAAANINYDRDIVEIIEHIIPATSTHVIRAAFIRYLQDHGMENVKDYNPADFDEPPTT